MIDLSISKEQVGRARQKAKEMGELRDSITRGQGNVAGFLGEILIADLLNCEINNTYNYDLISPTGEKIDVKTKRTNFQPRDYYECSIAAFNIRQKCDKYIFVRVKNDFSKAWGLGWKDKGDYFKNAKHLKKGEVDPDNNFTVKADCYNLAISKLNNLNELL